MAIPLNDGTEYEPSPFQKSEWQSAYPAVNVESELRRMAVWSQSNPKNRKTRLGVDRFINTWLSKAQDKSVPAPNSKPEPQQRKAESADEWRHIWTLDRIVACKLEGKTYTTPDQFKIDLWSLADRAIEKVRNEEWESDAYMKSACFGTAFVDLKKAWV